MYFSLVEVTLRMPQPGPDARLRLIHALLHTLKGVHLAGVQHGEKGKRGRSVRITGRPDQPRLLRLHLLRAAGHDL